MKFPSPFSLTQPFLRVWLFQLTSSLGVAKNISKFCQNLWTEIISIRGASNDSIGKRECKVVDSMINEPLPACKTVQDVL